MLSAKSMWFRKKSTKGDFMSWVIPGCLNYAPHNLGVRLRRPDTTAIWAPNTEAFLCDTHAAQGMIITIILEPTTTGQIETKVSGIKPPTHDRTTPISQTP